MCVTYGGEDDEQGPEADDEDHLPAQHHLTLGHLLPWLLAADLAVPRGGHTAAGAAVVELLARLAAGDGGQGAAAGAALLRPGPALQGGRD